ncbi:TBC1 domain family member 25-like isoform X2 [Lineus longissimus]|uniref:TBC1 domain family member 25-like isoform X2 n=1 Tax=Lineus longissimus TaxID=88925 RepID=UPI002B4D0023
MYPDTKMKKKMGDSPLSSCEKLMEDSPLSSSEDSPLTSYEKMEISPVSSCEFAFGNYFFLLSKEAASHTDYNMNFTISYLSKDDHGREVYTSLLSDWDLDAAFLSASDPCLRLKVDLKPFEEGLDDWDIIGQKDIPHPKVAKDEKVAASFLGSLTDTISSQIGKTVSTVQRAVGLKTIDDEIYKPVKSPMTDQEFHSYLDTEGRLVRPHEFRLSIYKGGVENSLRRVVWRHILNVYPEGLTGQERFAFLKAKSEEYYNMRDEWIEQFQNNSCSEEVKFVANMVKKDVLRTDRTHRFYAGSDDNKNVLMLFNILVTYALTHPSVSYCQGMSDIASPILVIQKDEAQAYICFCAIMRRLKANFQLDGTVMSVKFQHLSELLQHQDPDFYNYLKNQGADDLLFTYRWLLLELKREFPFDDTLFMLEVLWSSLPPDPPDSDLDLVEKAISLRNLVQLPKSPGCQLQRQSSVYLRLRHLRRQATSPVSKEPPDIIVEESGMQSELVHETEKNGTSPVVSLNGSHDAITPMDEEKFLEESHEYLAFQDSVTTSLLAKSSSIDQSLKNSNSSRLSRQSAVDTESAEHSISKHRSSPSRPKPMSPPRSSNRSSPAKFIHKLVKRASSMSSPTSPERVASPPQVKPRTKSLTRAESDDKAYRNSPTKTAPTRPQKISASVESATMFPRSDESSPRRTSPSQQGGICTCKNKLNASGRSALASPQGQHCSTSSMASSSPIRIPQGSRSVSDCQNGNGQNGSAEGKVRSECKQQVCTCSKNPQNSPEKKTKVRPSNIDIPDAASNFCQPGDKKTEKTGEGGKTDTNSNSGSGHPSIDFIKVKDRLPKLPSPDEFGNGNPFLMFLSITLLLQHRDHIMRNNLDYNDLAMHFDKMARKHNVWRVLHQAQSLYAVYLKAQQTKMEERDDAGSDYDVSV